MSLVNLLCLTGKAQKVKLILSRNLKKQMISLLLLTLKVERMELLQWPVAPLLLVVLT